MATADSVEIPARVLISVQTLDELEDWLVANNPDFVARMRAIREEEDLGGKGTDLSELTKRWPIES